MGKKKEKKEKKAKAKTEVEAEASNAAPTAPTDDPSPVAARQISKSEPKPASRPRKKNAPDRPQPAWLFPPDEENPILNPKPKNEEQTEKETQERLDAIEFLKRKAVGAPNKPQPPTLLLQLVGAFLGEYGFDSTGRLYTLERKARKRITGWQDDIGKKFKKGTPTLLEIFRQWHADWDAMEQEEETSSEEDESEEEEISDVKEEASSDSSSSEDSDDSGKKKKDSKSKAKAKGKTEKSKKSEKAKDSSESSSESEEEFANPPAPAPAAPARPTVNGMLEKLKARQTPQATKPEPTKPTKQVSSGSDSGSESDSESSESEEPAKKPSKSAKKKASKKSSSNSSTKSKPSDDSSDSSSDSSDGGVSTQTKAVPDPAKTEMTGITSSNSSSTLDTSPQNTPLPGSGSGSSDSSSPSSDTSEEEPKNTKPAAESATTSAKRKRASSPGHKEATNGTSKYARKNNAPFQRVAADTKVDPRFSSNKYVPYDYAQRAHEDLIVTRGKGFTKEKNKKKRGSYRGGPIDISGGKAVKFED